MKQIKKQPDTSLIVLLTETILRFAAERLEMRLFRGKSRVAPVPRPTVV